MRIFILEDDPIRIGTFMAKLTALPGRQVVCVDTAKDAIAALEEHEICYEAGFDLIFLDHDLGGEQMVSTEGANTGSAVTRWMRSNMKRYVPVIIHSLNAPAAVSMQQDLEEVGMQVWRIPYTNLVKCLDEPGFITQ